MLAAEPAGCHVSPDHVHQTAKHMQGGARHSFALSASAVLWYVYSTSLQDIERQLKVMDQCQHARQQRCAGRTTTNEYSLLLVDSPIPVANTLASTNLAGAQTAGLSTCCAYRTPWHHVCVQWSKTNGGLALWRCQTGSTRTGQSPLLL